MTRLKSHTLARLRSQMSRAELVLFIGAGFASDAKDRYGNQIPDVRQLKQELWDLCFPSADFEEKTSLGDLFGAAFRQEPRRLDVLLKNRLTVDPDSLPDYYQVILDLPWHCCYTLNIDDLLLAATRRFGLRREPVPISATYTNQACRPGPVDPGRQMELIHLNGVVTDPLHSLTFSETQYAERVARQEPLYARCVADLTARPVVFVGTELREITLWQHMELRRTHPGGGRDMRPASILVSPSLSPAREVILQEYKIEWISGTAESFTTDVLAGFTDVASKGFHILGDPDRRGSYGQVPLVADIAPKRANLSTEYLLGEEPHWSDLFQGRAVERNHDKDLGTLAMSILSGHTSNTAIGVSGTAGTGKSTALMRLGLSLSDFGIPVLWVDKNSDASPFTIRQAVKRYTGRIALLIDDSDLYGSQLPSMIQDLVPCRSKFLFVFAVRSSPAFSSGRFSLPSCNRDSAARTHCSTVNGYRH